MEHDLFNHKSKLLKQLNQCKTWVGMERIFSEGVEEVKIRERLLRILQEYKKKKAEEGNKITSDQIFDQIAKVIGIGYDTVYNFFYRESQNDIIDKEYIDKLATFFDISSSRIERDTEKYKRGMMKANIEIREKVLDIVGEEYCTEKNLTDEELLNKFEAELIFNSELESQFFEVEKRNLRESINEELNKLNYISLSKIIELLDAVMALSDEDWEFLCWYSLLNEQNKAKVIKLLQEMQTPIKDCVQVIKSNLETIKFYIGICSPKKERYSTEDKDKFKLIEKINSKIFDSNLPLVETVRFSNRIIMYTMQEEDWNVLLMLKLVECHHSEFILKAMKTFKSEQFED